MNKKNSIGFLIGLIAGIIDLVTMILQGLTWDAVPEAYTNGLSSDFFWQAPFYSITTMP